MTTQPQRTLAFEELDPDFTALHRDILFGTVWERAGLSKRDRSLITVAMLTALYRTNQLRSHIRRALDNGVTKEELLRTFEHCAFYSGWPCAANAYELAKEVFASYPAP